MFECKDCGYLGDWEECRDCFDVKVCPNCGYCQYCHEFTKVDEY
jgi:uncharacterized protein (DUF2225 family)